MNFKSPQLALAALLVAWLALAAPSLRTQIDKTLRTRALFEGRDADQRTALVDNPGFRVAQEISIAVPPSECVVVLAYAGPAAIDYWLFRVFSGCPADPCAVMQFLWDRYRPLRSLA